MMIDTKNLPNDVEQLKQMLLWQYQQNTFLQESLRLAVFKRFGSRSESINPAQKSLFDEVEQIVSEAEGIEASDENLDADKESKQKIGEYERRSPSRKTLPSGLPRVEVHHELPEADRTCAEHGCALKEMGTETSEQLDIIPATVRVIQNIRHKYCCPQCEGNIKIAPMKPQIIPKSMATPGLLAHIAVCKYEDSLPLYRQEGIFNRCDIDISRATLARWMISCGNSLMPLLNLMREQALDCGYLQCDETTIQVLKEANRPAESKSYMWVMASVSSDKKVVLYEYRTTRSGKTAEQLLEGFNGYLQSDGYKGYNQVGKKAGITHIGCWAHVRRKYFEAVKAAPKNQKDGIAVEMLAYIRMLYKIEEKYGYLSPPERLHERQSRARPILDKIKNLIDGNIAHIPPKSATGKALNYTLSEWPKLVRYLDDSRLRIDNNFVENKIRPFCVGRKNWLFADTPAGADASAALYSIIVTAKANGIDAYTYLRQLFDKLPAATKLEDYEALLPWNFKTTIH